MIQIKASALIADLKALQAENAAIRTEREVEQKRSSAAFDEAAELRERVLSLEAEADGMCRVHRAGLAALRADLAVEQKRNAALRDANEGLQAALKDADTLLNIYKGAITPADGVGDPEDQIANLKVELAAEREKVAGLEQDYKLAALALDYTNRMKMSADLALDDRDTELTTLKAQIEKAVEILRPELNSMHGYWAAGKALAALQEPASESFKLICHRCKVDRTKEACPGPLHMCPMGGTAHDTPIGDKLGLDGLGGVSVRTAPTRDHPPSRLCECPECEADFADKPIECDFAMRCRKCGGEMIPSKAIEQTYTTGAPDFPGDDQGVTLSPGGPGKLIDCAKCSACGWSVTPASAGKEKDRD